MHHFVTEMCTGVHISVSKWCIVGYLSSAFWDLWDGSIKARVAQPSFSCSDHLLSQGIVSLTFWKLSKMFSKLGYCRHHTSYENFKLKLCTCPHTHALGTCTKLHHEILTKNVIFGIVYFCEIILESSQTTPSKVERSGLSCPLASGCIFHDDFMSFSPSTGNPPQCNAWVGQCGLYILVMLVEKILMTLLVLFHFWREVGHVLTHWGRDKMGAILQTPLSNAFSSMKNFEFR